MEGFVLGIDRLVGWGGRGGLTGCVEVSDFGLKGGLRETAMVVDSVRCLYLFLYIYCCNFEKQSGYSKNVEIRVCLLLLHTTFLDR